MPLIHPKLNHQPRAHIWPLILARLAVRPGGPITVKFVLRYGTGALWVFASSYPPQSLIGWEGYSCKVKAGASRHKPVAALSAVDFEARAYRDMAHTEKPPESCHQSHRALTLMLFRHNQAIMHR